MPRTRKPSLMMPLAALSGPYKKALMGSTRVPGNTAAAVRGVAASLLVLAWPPPALLALNVGVKPTKTGSGVTGTLIVLLPFTGMGVLLVQVAVLVVNGSGGWVAVQVHGPLVKLAGALVPAGKLTVVVIGPLVGATPTLLTVTGKVLGTVACNAGCGLPMLVVRSGLVATVKLVAVGELLLPAGSVAVAVMLCKPSVSGTLDGQLHAPLALVTAVQSVVPPSLIVTVLLGSPVPLAARC